MCVYITAYFLQSNKNLQVLPPLMQILKIILPLQPQPRRQIRLRILLLRRPPIAQEPKPVLATLIRILKVFPLRLAQDSGQMRSTAGPDTVDARSGSPAVVPGAALAAHVGAREEGIAVGYEVVCGALGGRCGADALRGDLAEEFGDVGCLDFGAVGHGA